jgi:3-hydroxybutyryl-CoA dehydrogenase
MTVNFENATVAIVGAGIMGSGIAQVAAQAGHPVLLYDVSPGAALAEKEKLTQTF